MAPARDALVSAPDTTIRLERLGTRGEGIGYADGRTVAIPFGVPGDVFASITAEHASEGARLLTPSPERVAPFCPWFTRCGGCATQNTALSVQLRWKRDLVGSALAAAGLTTTIADCINAHGEGRRRATFHARRGADGHMAVGFMAARSHDLVAIDHCPLFAPDMADALAAARTIATTLAALGAPLDLAVTATQTGLDMDVRGTGPLPDAMHSALIAAAKRIGLARVSNHGRPVVTFRPPQLRIGDVDVVFPPAAFLQATHAGENALAALVVDAAKGRTRIADLYCGIGTFALRLAEGADVFAAESHAPAMEALLDAAHRTPGLRTVRGETRDLARRPLSRVELSAFDAVVFDPPRAGAIEQVEEIARSQVPLVIGVSCNPQTFARDAKMLVDGGYSFERVTPVDQFRHSAHVEMVGVFRRAKAKTKRKLLG